MFVIHARKQAKNNAFLPHYTGRRQGCSQDFSLGHRSSAKGTRRESRRREGWSVGRGTLGWSLGSGLCSCPEKFLNFYIEMVSSGAFWVAISNRLAAWEIEGKK